MKEETEAVLLYRSAVPSSGIDHDKEVPANERTGSAAYSMAMLCKQDKEQLDRIEAMLKQYIDANAD